jgi:hypothetical protein
MSLAGKGGSTKEQVASDSFVAFALKVKLILSTVTKGHLPHLQRLGVAFAGTPMNKTLFFATQSFIDKASPAVIAILDVIRAEFGKDVLTKRYSKLWIICRIVVREAPIFDSTPQELMLYVLEGLLFHLRFELVSPENLTAPALETMPKSGKVGLVSVILATKAIVTYFASVVSDAHKAVTNAAVHKELCELLEGCECYGTFELKFPPVALPSSEGEHNLPIVKWKEGKTLLAKEAADFMYDLFGNVYGEHIKNMALDEKTNYMTVEWSEVEGFKPLGQLVQALHTRSAAVESGTSDSAPPASARMLSRLNSDPAYQESRLADIQKERNDLWNRATKERKRYVSISHCKVSLKLHLTDHIQKIKQVADWKGEPLHAHRLFVFSAELFHEHRSEPWSKGAEWSVDAKNMVLLALEQKRPEDVVLLFDGRSRKCRREIEKLCDEANPTHFVEMHIAYKPTSRLGRKVAFSGQNIETAFCITQFPRTRLVAVERTKFNSMGETSSHEASYSGVPPRPWGSLPLLQEKDKVQISGEAPSPAAGVFDTTAGHPLSWSERKPVDLWTVMLSELKVRCVVDLSPGSGALGRACLDQGWQYAAICRSEEHCSWLQNVLNRAAVESITRSGTALFEQDLSACISEHFKDVVNKLHAQDAAEDNVLDEA